MKCCRFGASSVYTIQPCTRFQCHFIQGHISMVYACLAVTYHLHFWQNDRDILRATAVTRGWNGYRNKSQHRNRPWRRKLSGASCRDSNPRPFNYESGAVTTELSRSPNTLDIFFQTLSIHHIAIGKVQYLHLSPFHRYFVALKRGLPRKSAHILYCPRSF